MFELSSSQNYVVPEWAGYTWLRHGFGTKNSPFPSEALATVKQIHGTEVKFVDQPGQHGTGDGLISCTKGLVVGIKTADCLPILLIDPVQRAVSAVHAGWRGTVAGIAAHALQLMAKQVGSVPAEMEAAIGPGIGLCCFEVGPEVAREFGPWNSEAKSCLDLASINRQQLEEKGLKKIYGAGLCTLCGIGFHSFRRDREEAGRMISYVGLAGSV